MALRTGYVDVVRKRIERWFLNTASFGRGPVPGVFYNVTATNVQRNVYHDKVTDDVASGAGVEIQCVIARNVPIKVAQKLGLWKEDEAIPILMYIPWKDGVDPRKDCRVVIPTEEGYVADAWEIMSVKVLGQGRALFWVCTVQPGRNTSAPTYTGFDGTFENTL